MAGCEGILGHKRIELLVDAADDDNFVPVADLVSVDPPDMEIEESELTTLDDDGRNYCLDGPIDYGSVVCTQRWVPGDTGHDTIETYMKAKQAKNWTIRYITNDPSDGDGQDQVFSGQVSAIAPASTGPADFLQRDFTIRLNTAHSWAPYSPGP